MKIVFMNGGLGNQLFQYIFFRYLALRTGEACFIDDSAFWGDNVPHCGYELERVFGLKNNLLSEFFDEDIWQEMIKQKGRERGICQQLLDGGLDISMVAESSNFQFSGKIFKTKNSVYCPEIIQAQGNIYYHGYWIQQKWFQAIADAIRQELLFPVLRDIRNLRYANMIKNSNSVAVHIRRGDFVDLHITVSPAYYEQTIKRMEQERQEYHYFIFSDDLEWCKAHAAELGIDSFLERVCFVRGNSGVKAYIDLQLMSLCKHMIISNSSFSYLAALLNCNNDKQIWAPAGNTARYE